MSAYKLVEEPEGGGWSIWYWLDRQKDGKPHRIACCDCGLVHEVEVRKFKGRFEWRWKRHRRATAGMRRAKS